jgi:hypothetical protein
MAETWLSYDDIADRLRITPASARNLVRRKRWQRRPGNDGRARIAVPDDALCVSTGGASVVDIEGGTDAPQPVSPDNQVHLALARLEVEVAGLRELVVAERGRAEAEGRRADGEAKRADAAEADRDAWRAIADRPWWRRLIRAA